MRLRQDGAPTLVEAAQAPNTYYGVRMSAKTRDSRQQELATHEVPRRGDPVKRAWYRCRRGRWRLAWGKAERVSLTGGGVEMDGIHAGPQALIVWLGGGLWGSWWVLGFVGG